MKILFELLDTLLTESANNNKEFIRAYISRYLSKKKKIRDFFAALDEIKDTSKQQHAIEAVLTLDSNHFQKLIAILLEKRKTDDYLRGNDVLAKIIEHSINEESYKEFIICSVSAELAKQLLIFIDDFGHPIPNFNKETSDLKSQLSCAFDKIFNNLIEKLPEKAKLICATIYEDLSNKYALPGKQNNPKEQTIRALFLNRFIAPIFIHAAQHQLNEKSKALYLRVLPMTAQGFSTLPEKSDKLAIPQPCKELAFDEVYRKKIDECFKLLVKHQTIKIHKAGEFDLIPDNVFIELINQAKKYNEQFKKNIQNEIDDIEDKLKLINYRLTSIGKPLTGNTAITLAEQEITTIKFRFENKNSDKNISLINNIRLSGLKAEFIKLQSSLNLKKDEQLKAIQIFREFINDLEKMIDSDQKASLTTQSPKTKRMVRERSNTVITPGSNEHKEVLVSLKPTEKVTQATDTFSDTTKQHHVRSNATFFNSTTALLPNKTPTQPRKTSEPASLPTVLQRKKSVPTLGLKKIQMEPAKEKNKTSLTARPQQ